MIRYLYFISLICVIISCLIFPNSLQVLSAISLGVCFVCAFINMRLNKQSLYFFGFWVIASFVTLFYLLLGVIKGAPDAAVFQVLSIYILFPLFWIVVLKYILEVLSPDYLVKGLLLTGLAACLSVIFFYYNFLVNGPDSVGFFIQGANVNVSKAGFIAATMHVFGTLIFLTGGYVSAYGLFNGSKKNSALLALFVFVALISGRSALILSIIVGLSINIVIYIRNPNFKKRDGFLKKMALLVSFVLAITLVFKYFELSFLAVLAPLFDKIYSGGGGERSSQFIGLISGFSDNFGFGSGHGIGIDYVASDIYPWRYEMVWVALLYRVGLIGTLIYLAPFLLTLAYGVSKLFKGELDDNEAFIFGGFVSVLIASNTNPYIEAFVFQWMYIFPVLYFLSRVKRANTYLWFKAV